MKRKRSDTKKRITGREINEIERKQEKREGIKRGDDKGAIQEGWSEKRKKNRKMNNKE